MSSRWFIGCKSVCVCCSSIRLHLAFQDSVLEVLLLHKDAVVICDLIWAVANYFGLGWRQIGCICSTSVRSILYKVVKLLVLRRSLRCLLLLCCSVWVAISLLLSKLARFQPEYPRRQVDLGSLFARTGQHLQLLVPGSLDQGWILFFLVRKLNLLHLW